MSSHISTETVEIVIKGSDQDGDIDKNIKTPRAETESGDEVPVFSTRRRGVRVQRDSDMSEGETETDSIYLEVGERYRLEGAVLYSGSEEMYSEENELAEKYDCPECEDGDIKFEGGILEGVSEGELEEETNLIITSETAVRKLSEDDDWIPFSSQADRHRQNVIGRFTCSECHFEVDYAEGEELESIEEILDGSRMSNMVEEMSAPSASHAAESQIGMSVGGGKDVGNFRENIHNGYTPQLDSITYEGLFYDYYFDTGDDRERDSLFYPTYSNAVSMDPLSDGTERYMTVGLNSNLSTEEFERKKLNLVVVLDVSGSMSSPFQEYYYDETGERQEVEGDSTTSKMEAARESLVKLTHHLREDDRFGVVLYNADSHEAKPLNPVGETDMDAIRGHIRDLKSGGGTNMGAGMEQAIGMLEPYSDEDYTEVENRIIFFTDAMPNTGSTDKNTLSDHIEEAAQKGIHTTFAGVGIDANQDLIESLSGIRGANHYFINSVDEFKQRLDDEFEYMVTPLVFDLSLEIESDGYEVKEIYGSPNSDGGTDSTQTDEIMNVSTLFPSPKSEGETRGGVVLVELKKSGSGSEIGLKTSWEERSGERKQDEITVEVPDVEPEHFDNSGIRKSVALARYGRLLRRWIGEVRSEDQNDEEVDDWRLKKQNGRGKWEQESMELKVPRDLESDIRRFREYLNLEAVDLGEDEMEQEVEILDTLIEEAKSTDTSAV